MKNQDEMPKDKGLDHTIQLLKEGYNFIINRRDSFDSNVFETRLLGQKAFCLSGSKAAEIFYDANKFQRAGAAPLPLRKTLFGEGGVQGLDDDTHRHRKALFMSLCTDDRMAELRRLTREYFVQASKAWEQQDCIELYQEAKLIMTRVICEWAGVPLQNEEVVERATQLSELYEKAGHVGLSHFKGWKARSKAEDWIEGMVIAVRSGEMRTDPEKVLGKFSSYRDQAGELLDKETVAVEVLNMLRPTVANAVWIAFSALAINDYPDQVKMLQLGNRHHLVNFCQEVRRFYPFFPFTVALVRRDFEWQGYTFEEGTLTLLDLYGTNHHPGEWENADAFNAQRFETTPRTPFNFLPQGGGDYESGHRCAGEWMTLIILEESIDFLVNRLDYELPEQDLSYSMNDFPSTPKSGIRMSNVRLSKEQTN